MPALDHVQLIEARRQPVGRYMPTLGSPMGIANLQTERLTLSATRGICYSEGLDQLIR
ncbi:MAG: hypothetical protein AAGG44_00360 [Planctomycetota bacterium]